MLVHLRRAIVLSVVMIVLCLVYTGVETAIGQVAFKYQANGSLIKQGNTVIGSALIGQSWTGPTSYGPRSEQLYEQVIQAEANLKKEGITPTNGLVTGSGSGIDPDISPADALAQVNAVAKANNLPVSTVKALVERYSAPVYLGIFGSPYVNVMSLNMALAALTAGSR